MLTDRIDTIHKEETKPVNLMRGAKRRSELDTLGIKLLTKPDYRNRTKER